MAEVLIKERKEPILELVEEMLSKPMTGPTWLKDIRKKSLDRFLELGIPTPKLEPWRFTNLSPLKEIPFKPVDQITDLSTLESLKALSFSDLDCPRLIFINGHLVSDTSSIRSFPEGMKVTPISDAIDRDDPSLKKHLGQYLETNDHAFAALNMALFSDGALIEIPPGSIINSPVQLVFISTADHSPVLSAPRTLIVSGENSQATIIETHLGIGEAQYLTIPVTEVAAGENSVIEHYKVQMESENSYHLGFVCGSEGANTSLCTTTFSLSGAIIRNDTSVKLEGEGGWAELNGLFLTKDEHHVDNYTTINHIKPHCDSREHFKGILSDRSRGVFRGRIIVAKGAQKTDSKQTNNNLLLSDDAKINTKPQLEIYADDVKCTHGATVGQLDEESIFYLRARGISKDVAHSMLIYAFAGELCNRVKVEKLKQALNDYLFSRLPHGDDLRAAG